MQQSAIPYQAYRSKRHSRTASALPIPANVPPPSTRPLSGDDWVSEKLVLASDPPSPPSADPDPVAPAADLPADPPAPDAPPPVDGQPASPSPASSSAPLPPVPASAPRKATTLRRLQPRPSAARAPPQPSPLRPNDAHSRPPSAASAPARYVSPSSRSPPLHSRVPSANSALGDDRSHRSSPSHTPNSSSGVPSESLAHPTPRSTSLSVPAPASVASSASPSPITSPPLSTSPLPPRTSAPYRPGFQPNGVCRLRTDEFAQARKTIHDATRIERTKLERRLEKLIHLHFPLQTGDSKLAKKPPADRRRSSLFDFDLAALRNMDATDVWKGVVQSQASQGAKSDIRAAEQRIAPWQEDATVPKCPLCNASFHPLTNRKHHCRLCGKIICSLPVKRPQRPQPCSILFIVDPKARKIEEVGEGVDYGVKRRANGAATGKGTGKQNENETLPDDEKFLKGVRLCRTCKPTLAREQFYQEVSRIPLLVRLYVAFIDLEREIEEVLPQFQELLLTLGSDSPPTKEAVAARKRILEDFAAYDAISKRIRKTPCAPGSSQDRVQLAIRTRADLFLQKNMLPLQASFCPSLPKPKKRTSSPDPATPLVDPDSALAHALQPLLEQEALLESFVDEAMAHRKFEDARTLKASLKEIKAEIDRMLENRPTNGSAQEGIVAG